MMEYLLITAMQLFLALMPPLAVIFLVWLRDRYEREPFRPLALAFLMGCLSVVPAVAMQTASHFLDFGENVYLLNTFSYAFYIVGFSEEVSKFFFLRYFCFPQKDFNEPYDGIIYSVALGMGFASVENLFYTFNQPSFEQGIMAAMARCFTAIPAHATFAVVMGYYAGLAKFRPEKRNVLLLAGLLMAALLHAVYDFFLIQKSSQMLGFGAFAALMVALSVSLRAIRLHTFNSPFRPVAEKEE
jgi:RsiW-degrading membrane proteinase PrsW (M82 family)